jgi:ATP-dependent exoDNAse (exonuclease V) beta subunit
VGETQLDSFDVSNMFPAPLLLQTGYLTIDRVKTMTNRRSYYLRFPNHEVQDAFEVHLLSMLLKKPLSEMESEVIQMQIALEENDLDTLRKLLTAHIASIPYGAVEHIEKTYQNIIFSLFRLIGADMRNEVHTNRGRIDAVITTPTHIYVIEFKMDQSATAAITQIEDKDYTGQYLTSGKQVVKIGINFSEELRNIDDWKEVVISG